MGSPVIGQQYLWLASNIDVAVLAAGPSSPCTGHRVQRSRTKSATFSRSFPIPVSAAARRHARIGSKQASTVRSLRMASLEANPNSLAMTSSSQTWCALVAATPSAYSSYKKGRFRGPGLTGGSNGLVPSRGNRHVSSSPARAYDGASSRCTSTVPSESRHT